jgi:hypothetical protein
MESTQKCFGALVRHQEVSGCCPSYGGRGATLFDAMIDLPGHGQ